MAFIIEYCGTPRTILRTINDFGFESYDLVSPPRRLLGPASTIPLLENNIDKRRTTIVPTTRVKKIRHDIIYFYYFIHKLYHLIYYKFYYCFY